MSFSSARWVLWFGVCCWSLAAGCGAPRPAPAGPAAATKAPASPSARPPTAPHAEKSPRSSVEVEARASESQPFTSCTAEVRPLPLRGVELYQSDLPSAGDNVVAYAKLTAKSRDNERVLVDAASAKRVAALGDVYVGDQRLHLAIVSRPGSNSQELVDLTNGSRVRPRITTPEGAPKSWRLGLDGRTGRVWLLARTRHDTAYFGLWPEPRSATVSLQHALPFWPKTLMGGSGVLVGNDEQSCLLADDGASCFPALASERLLDGRYVVELFGSRIYDAAARQELELGLGGDCEWSARATLEEPPRVLFACKTPGEVSWMVWSPQGILARWTSGDWLWPTSARSTPEWYRSSSWYDPTRSSAIGSTSWSVDSS